MELFQMAISYGKMAGILSKKCNRPHPGCCGALPWRPLGSRSTKGLFRGKNKAPVMGGLRSSKALVRKRVSSIGGSPPMLTSKHLGMLPELAGHAHPHHVDLVAETKSTVVWRYSRGVPQVIMEVFDPPNPVVVQRDLNAT